MKEDKAPTKPSACDLGPLHKKVCALVTDIMYDMLDLKVRSLGALNMLDADGGGGKRLSLSLPGVAQAYLTPSCADTEPGALDTMQAISSVPTETLVAFLPMTSGYKAELRRIRESVESA